MATEQAKGQDEQTAPKNGGDTQGVGVWVCGKPHVELNQGEIVAQSLRTAPGRGKTPLVASLPARSCMTRMSSKPSAVATAPELWPVALKFAGSLALNKSVTVVLAAQLPASPLRVLAGKPSMRRKSTSPSCCGSTRPLLSISRLQAKLLLLVVVMLRTTKPVTGDVKRCGRIRSPAVIGAWRIPVQPEGTLH
jgi:hypothetical protein